MVFLTLTDLIPFVVTFVLFVLFFALLYYVLKLDFDEELADVSGPIFGSEFGKIVL
jgi:hypothetical protein